MRFTTVREIGLNMPVGYIDMSEKPEGIFLLARVAINAAAASETECVKSMLSARKKQTEKTSLEREGAGKKNKCNVQEIEYAGRFYSSPWRHNTAHVGILLGSARPIIRSAGICQGYMGADPAILRDRAGSNGRSVKFVRSFSMPPLPLFGFHAFMPRSEHRAEHFKPFVVSTTFRLGNCKAVRLE